MVVFALTRWPGLMPPNFSAVYALMFCAGVYFPKRLAWWLPFAMMFITDILLTRFYYHASFGWEIIGNYVCYAVLVWLGRRFSPKASWLALVGGGLLGAIIFYLVSNTFSWLFNPYHNPEYTRTIAGWIKALTTGISGWPQTWEFFRNTLTSSGLFTGVFAGAMKIMEALEPEEDEEPVQEPEKDEQPREAEAS